MSEEQQRYKEPLFEALKVTHGNVKKACEQVGCTRQTFYNYLKSDPDFKVKVDEIREIRKDFIEDKIFERVKNGKATDALLIFLAKTVCRDRGYIEKQEHDHTVKGDKDLPVPIHIQYREE